MLTYIGDVQIARVASRCAAPAGEYLLIAERILAVQPSWFAPRDNSILRHIHRQRPLRG